MRPIAILAAVLAGAACAPVTPQTVATPTACETTTVPVTVGGRPEQATVEACPQPDGSWRITQTTPGLPPQVYLMLAPPPDIYPAIAPDYPDYSPYWAAAPWFWGIGIGPSVVVVERFRHPHRLGPVRPGLGHLTSRGFGHGAAGARSGAGMRR
jgi:hypothetical protein